jgi:hypothetical protein
MPVFSIFYHFLDAIENISEINKIKEKFSLSPMVWFLFINPGKFLETSNSRCKVRTVTQRF